MSAGSISKFPSYNGWLIIDKPLGITSAHVVSKVKRLLGRNTKVGHAGTLDPLASGVLPLALGEATKVVQFLLDSSKEYEFEVTWGEERATDDSEGAVVQMSDARCQMSEILEAMEGFKGEIDQMPPNYSALKVDGKKAYDLARAGKEVMLKTRKVTIHELSLTSDIRHLTSAFRMRCSKGTYVRSIARDMGRKLGCFGYVSLLKRTAHGQFGSNRAISLEKLADMCENGAVSTCILPVEEVLDGIPAFPLDSFQEAKIRNGVPIDNVSGLTSGIIVLTKDGKLVAIAAPENSKLWPRRVFNH